MGLFQNNVGGATSASDAEGYYEWAGEPQGVPVLADPSEQLFASTPYAGTPLPGKCLLSPTMEMLMCWTGHGDDAEAFEMIEAHAAVQ